MTDTVTRPMNIYQRLNEVRKAVAYVQKDKKVDGAGYMAVTHDAVTAAVRDHLITHGVMIVLRLIKAVTVQDSGMTTAKGIPIIRYEATFEIDFVNCDDPADKVTVCLESHALDNGDKAPGKAASYATKYAMLKLFSIETGEDDEARPDAKPAKAAASKPSDGVETRIAAERKEPLNRVLSSVMDCLEADLPAEAVKALGEITDPDEKVWIWTNLDSKQRSLIKRTSETLKKVKSDGISA